MPPTRNLKKKRIDYEESLSSDDSDYCWATTSSRRSKRTSSRKNNVPYKHRISSDDSDCECDEVLFKKKAHIGKKIRKTRHNSTVPKYRDDKKCSKIIEFSDSDNEDVSYNIKAAHQEDIKIKVNNFFKNFDSDTDDDDLLKNSPVSKLEHKQCHKPKKEEKDRYTLSSDAELEEFVKPSTSTCNLVNKVTEYKNDLKPVIPVTKTTSENLFSFVDDILKNSDIINTGVDKIKDNLCKTSFEDLMKKTNELLDNVVTVSNYLTSKPKEPETVVIEKEGPICPVCFEILSGDSKAMVTVCGHMFCERCILQVVETVKKCPTCRKGITKKKYHPVYL